MGMQSLYRKHGVWRMDWNWVKEYWRGFKKDSRRVIRRYDKQRLKKKEDL